MELVKAPLAVPGTIVKREGSGTLHMKRTPTTPADTAPVCPGDCPCTVGARPNSRLLCTPYGTRHPFPTFSIRHHQLAVWPLGKLREGESWGRFSLLVQLRIPPLKVLNTGLLVVSHATQPVCNAIVLPLNVHEVKSTWLMRLH